MNHSKVTSLISTHSFSSFVVKLYTSVTFAFLLSIITIMDNMIEWLRKAKSMNNRGMADGAINRFVFMVSVANFLSVLYSYSKVKMD